MKKKLIKGIQAFLIGSLFCSLLVSLSPIKLEANTRKETKKLSSENIDLKSEIDYEGVDKATLNIEAITLSDDVQFVSMKDPSLMIHPEIHLSYEVTQNGTYAFWIDYLINNEERTQEFFVDVYDLKTTSIEGEIPSYETGWVPAGDIDRSKVRAVDGEDKPAGKIFVKGIPIQVEVDNQIFSPQHDAMIAFMKDDKGNGLMCMDPHKFAAEDVVSYTDVISYEDMTPVPGKNGKETPAGELSLDWYFGAVYLPKKSTTNRLTETEWYLLTQLKLWKTLGYEYNPNSISDNMKSGMKEINDEVAKHNARLAAGNELKILTYADANDAVGTWVPFEENTQLSYNDPTVTKDKVIKVQVPKILSQDLVTNWDTKTPGIAMAYKTVGEVDEYSFKLVGSIEAGKTTVPFSIIPESIQGNPWFLDGSQTQDKFQSLMSFKVPKARSKMITFNFEPIAGDPNVPTPAPTITPPTFTKVDEEDGFPVQGANFEFRAGENFKMKWLVEKKKLVNTEFTPAVSCTNNPDTGQCEGGSPAYTTYTYEIEDPVPATSPAGKYKPAGIFPERDHFFNHKWITDADGKIDLTPIVNDITTAVDNHKTESAAQNEPASWGTTETIDDRIPSDELNYYYVDPDYYFENGKFTYSEPETSQNQFNTNAANKGDTDYVGYYNDYPTRKTSFTISATGSQDIEVENARQKGRITVHKTDNETSYLNHNNSHEPQGDGFFSGAKFDIVAAEDIILHDGTIVHNQGDIVESIITDENGTATTELLELGRYTVQEVRLPGVYDSETDDANLLTDGGYWYQDYNNGIDNPITAKVEKGGQIINVDITYTGQDNSYNEHVPGCAKMSDIGKQVTVNGETVQHTIPFEAIMDDMNMINNSGLDYVNNIQKGHLQLRKYISEVPGDNGQADQIGSANVQDVYFAIYLNSKAGSNLVEPLPDSYFTQKRLDGRVYTFDTNGNFYRNTKNEILYKENGDVVKELKGWVNPSLVNSSTSDITLANLSEKELYMVLKTNTLGNAGTNIPETILYANKAVVANTGTQGSYGAYDYANPNKLLASGLPLPYGEYTILELNPYEGYYPVSYQVKISRDTTDINGVVTELGIEVADQTTSTLRKQFYIFSDRLVASTIKDDLIRQNIEVTKRDIETGKSIPAANTAFKVWQWNTDFHLDPEKKRMEWVKDTLMKDDDGNFVCEDEFTVCVFNGVPSVATIKKVPLPTYSDASAAQRDAGEYQHWKISYIESETTKIENPTDPKLPGSYQVKTTVYDENNNFTQTRESDGKIITAPVGNWVTRTYTEPDAYGKTTRLVYTTNTEGQFTLPAGDPLIYGDYLLTEIEAPHGYTISSRPTYFSIEHKGGSVEPNAPIEIITVQLDQPNLPQKGAVNIVKKGDVLQTFKKYTSLLNFEAWKPIYNVDRVKAETIFEVYANEDIIVNNDIKYTENELIDTITTDSYGNGSSIELYLGKYRVIEKQAPHGYLTDGTPQDFELTYQGQNVTIYPIYKEQTNDRQNLKIEIKKALSNGSTANDIYFGVYTNQEFKLKEKIEIPVDPSSDEYLSGDIGFTKPERPAEEGIIETDIVPSFSAEGDFTFSNGSITAYTGTEANVVIPTSIGGENVTSIGEKAFDGKNLKSIVIPFSLSEIGAEALANNPKLASIEFFNYQTEIATELMINIDSSWINYDPILQKYIVPIGSKVEFDTSLDSEVDGTINYIPIIEKKIVDFIDPGYDVPTFTEETKETNKLPEGTLLEVIQIHNGVGVSNLDYPEGKYYVQEIKVPDNVIIDYTMYNFEFKFDETLGKTQTIVVNNGNPIINETTDEPNVPDRPTPTPSAKTIILDIDIIKSLEKDVLYGNTQAYKDVLFGVYAAKDLTEGKKTIYAKDELVFESGIDEKGDFLNVMSTANIDIPEGNYYVKEIKTSSDYILDDTKYPFTYEKERNKFFYTIDLKATLIMNELKRTHIIVYKVDRQETTKTLPGATFTLYDQDMKVLKVFTTGKDGIARFDNLPDGKYFVQETATPIGYTPSNEIKEVNIIGAQTIESKNNEYVIQWTNVLLPMHFENTASETNQTNLVLILTSLLGVSLLVLKTYRKVH